MLKCDKRYRNTYFEAIVKLSSESAVFFWSKELCSIIQTSFSSSVENVLHLSIYANAANSMGKMFANMWNVIVGTLLDFFLLYTSTPLLLFYVTFKVSI